MLSSIRLPLAVAAAAAFALVAAPTAMGSDDRTYRVKIRDRTSGQPMTPPVVATHRGRNLIFEVGSEASFGLKEIAENGNNGPLLGTLGADPRVSQAVEAPGGPLVPPGKPGSADFDDRTTFTIDAEREARRLSFVMMLICTNDGFTGVNSLRLPSKVGDKVTARTAAYDSGTELNTEDFADIVPPCQGLIGVSSGEPGTGQSNPALLEGGVIEHHAGILGGSDLVPAVHGWNTSRPVARITVKRID
jgi:Spondin_N